MATIIKAASPDSATGARTFAFDDLGDSGADHLDRVRRQAAEILAGAEQEAISIRRRAEEQGRTAALEAADEVLEENVGRRLATLVSALHGATDRIDATRAEWLAHWERAAIRVATSIASRVIRREVERTPEITLSLVREALELAAGSADIQLRLHPRDLSALGPHVTQLAAELARLGKPEIVADASIEPGGCRIDTRHGVIDQQFAAQLARIEQELT
jgi:flagellar assembly protein FliH